MNFMRFNINLKIALACLLLVPLAVSAQIDDTSTSGGPSVVTRYRIGQNATSDMLAPGNAIKNNHHYHLEKPRDGYEWIHGNNGDCLLISSTSHRIVEIVARPNITPEAKS
jgi:Ni/Co efflux regulator RcnB